MGETPSQKTEKWRQIFTFLSRSLLLSIFSLRLFLIFGLNEVLILMEIHRKKAGTPTHAYNLIWNGEKLGKVMLSHVHRKNKFLAIFHDRGSEMS